MPLITILSRAHAVQEIAALNGRSLMETIRSAGFDDLLALCGGCCSCATCHVKIVEPGTASLPPISEDESDLLDSSIHRDATSRLSCQIVVNGSMDGLRIFVVSDD